MKNQALFALFVAIGVSIGMTQFVRADFFSVAMNTGSQKGQGDLAGDVTALFALDAENARNLADIYSFCTESPQEGMWQEDPRTLREYPTEEGMNEPVMMFASFTPTNRGGGGGGGGGGDDDDDDNDDDDDDDDNSAPEPATMLMLGLGAAGLFAYRRRKQK